jgi:hypothetical protein
MHVSKEKKGGRNFLRDSFSRRLLRKMEGRKKVRPWKKFFFFKPAPPGTNYICGVNADK